jgi:oligopeptidase A
VLLVIATLPGKPEKRAELAALLARATELETAILHGFGDTPTMDIDERLLADLPEDVMASLEPGSTPSTRRVSVSYGVREELMRGVAERPVRERLRRLLQDRGRDDNTERMAELFRVRRSIAHLAGFDSWAALRTSVMAFGSPETARDALDDLAAAAHPVTRDYIAAVEAALGDEIDGGYQLWDQFRGQALLARGVGVDEAAFRRYLPMDRVVAGLFDLTREVFGIRVEERQERLGWHDDVRTLALFDDATGEQIGICLWDPYERDGKMAGAIAFMEMLEADVPGVDGRRPPVVTMLVTTFPEAVDGASQRLSLDEVDSLFHEFGHVLDYTVGSRVAGSLDESWWGTDFAEGPSFFFAAWARTPTVLERFAVDPATGEGIPRDAVAMLRVGQAIEDISFLERYIAFGRLDLAVHGPVEVDLDEAWQAAWADNPIPDPSGGFRPVPFSMVAGGYDAAVYGIPFALAVRDELLGAFESAGWLDPAVGRAYVERLLGPGPFVSAFARLEAFLGRPPDSGTLMHQLRSGIEAAAAASGIAQSTSTG